MNGHEGELVTETLDYDGGRPVTVYGPPGVPGSGRGCPPVPLPSPGCQPINYLLSIMFSHNDHHEIW